MKKPMRVRECAAFRSGRLRGEKLIFCPARIFGKDEEACGRVGAARKKTLEKARQAHFNSVCGTGGDHALFIFAAHFYHHLFPFPVFHPY